MLEIFSLGFMQRAAAASLATAVLCPVIGLLLVLRRTSMIGDALAHASLAGVAGALVFGVNPVAGSFAATGAAGVLVEALQRSFRERGDLILTVVLALAVGLAVTLITSGAVEARAENFLFGSILTVTPDDLKVIGAVTTAAVLYLVRALPFLTAIAFDEASARAAGVRVDLHRYALAFLTAAAVSAAIPVAGVLILSSMMALPVATALQLRRGFRATLLIALAVSLIDAAAGLMLVVWIDAAPGGLTALVSVLMLALVMGAQKLRAAAALARARAASPLR